MPHLRFHNRCDFCSINHQELLSSYGGRDEEVTELRNLYLSHSNLI